MKHIIILSLCITIVMAVEQKYEALSFSFFDVDKDGEITREEFKNAKQKLRADKESKRQAKSYYFYKIDTDGDGIIKVEEFSRYSIIRNSSGHVRDNECL